MISFFRRALSSWIVLALLALVIIAFIITGVGPGNGIGSLAAGDALATVEGEAVTTTEVTDQVNRQLARAREQQPELDLPTFLRGGILEELMNQLIASKAMTVFGRDQGLTASKRLIDGQIASIPAFLNLAGQFDNAAFQSALQREKISEQQLRDELATSIIQRQLLLPVAGSSRVPLGVAQEYASLLLEQRAGTVGLVPAQAMGAGAAPTPAELAAFYRQEQSRYAIPERRVLRYALIGAPQVAASARASDAEIQAFYNANTATYGAKQARILSQVVLPDRAAAQAFAAKLASGTSFAQAAQQAGFSVTDTAVGQQTREQFTTLTSASVTNAAFSAAPGAVTAPTQSPLGWHVVRVDAINDSAARPLAAVRAEIAAQIGQQKTQEGIADLVAKIEDAIGDGATFDEAARANGLAVQQTAPITATGIAPDMPGYRAPPEIAPLLKTAFEVGEGEDPTVEALQPGQYALTAVGRIVPAAPPPLASIASQVRTDFMVKRAGDRARAVAAAIVARINAGTPAREAFAGVGVPLPAPKAVKARRLDIAQQNQQVPPPLAMMFSLPRGKARLLSAPNGQGWFVVHLEQVVPGDARGTPGLIEATRTQFGRVVGEEYAQQFSRAVEGTLDIERKNDAVERLRKQLAGPGVQ